MDMCKEMERRDGCVLKEGREICFCGKGLICLYWCKGVTNVYRKK